jgi:hypothetical protein
MSRPWANPTVARLAEGDLCQRLEAPAAAADGTAAAAADDDDDDGDAAPRPEYCGLVLNCSWPMPADVLEQYEAWSASLRERLPAEAYVYPGSTLHCTICTMRPFTSGPLDGATREALRRVWEPVLDAARGSEGWPSGAFQLQMNAPTLEGSAAIFRYEDSGGAITAMRAALKQAISAAGGSAAEGGGDRSLSHAPDGVPERERSIGPHLPDIVHSTAVRWGSEPADRDAVGATFAEVAKTWTPLELTVHCAKAVFEDVP